MNRYYRYYKIAEIILKIDSSFPIEKYGTNDELFLINIDCADFTLYFEPITNINIYLQRKLKKVFTSGWADFFVDENNTEYCFFIQEGYYIAVTLYTSGANTATLYYLNKEIMQMRHKNGCSPLSYIRLEKVLVQNHALILHSCHIKYQNKALLFTAPSGTGKSTQGDLWKHYLQAEVINGDRTIIKENEIGWTAYGLPMSGTSGICKNMCEKLGAIIVIRQGQNNLIRSLSSFEAFQYIYSEVTLNTWDQSYIEQAISLISAIVKQVPIYYYQCTKDSSAVYSLYQQLVKDGVFEC